MKKLDHLSLPKSKVLSLTIIPSTNHKLVQFSIPYWLPISCLLFIITISAFSIGISTAYIRTQDSLTAAKNQVSALESINTGQTTEIETLRLRTAEIEEELLALNQLQSKVLNMVGLDNTQAMIEDTLETGIQGTAAQLPEFLVSRSNWRSSTINFEGTGGSISESNVSDLDQLIAQQKQSMEKLVVDVEKQLEYIDALPNLVPTSGRLSSPYGYRISPINRRREFHSGIDLANSVGTEIYASGSGVVTFSGYNGGYGRMIIISHGHGYSSVYAHNSSNLVRVGDQVSKGQTIAKMGSTGNSTGSHLHFEIRINGSTVDPYTVLN